MGGTRGRIGASGKVEASGEIKASERVGALLLPVSDLPTGPWRRANLSCFLIRLAGRLLQGLCQARNLKAIAIEI